MASPASTTPATSRRCSPSGTPRPAPGHPRRGGGGDPLPAPGQAGDDGEDETADAIGDHNKIRDAIAEAKLHPVGSDQWWEAVGTARRENSEHLAEEEDEALPDFRRHASTELRAELGQRWLTFYGEHKNGRNLPFRDKDPQQYVADHR